MSTETGTLPRFENPRGFDLGKLRDERRGFILAPLTIWEFRLDPEHPLTYITKQGLRIQPDRHVAETDMGSIPAILQPWISPSRFLLSYLFHDSAYHHHGLYVLVHRHGYVYDPMTRKAADQLLREMIRVEGGTRTRANIIYWAVRLCGEGGWNRGRKPA